MTEEIAQYRDLNIIGNEIRFLYTEGTKMELAYAIKIGCRLKEAKELCEHGEWTDWLKNNVPFSQSKANKLMAVHEKFGASQESLFGEINSETFTNLGISQAFLLLSVPDDEIKDFVEENHVEDMTANELRQALKERDEAIKARDEAENAVKSRDADAEKLKKRADKAEKEKQTAEKKLKLAVENEKAAITALENAKANPEVPPELLEELRREAETKVEETVEIARAEAAAAKNTIQALQKQLVMASPDITVFKTYFTDFQETFNRMVTVLGTVGNTDGETAEKLKAALSATLKAFEERIKE